MIVFGYVRRRRRRDVLVAKRLPPAWPLLAAATLRARAQHPDYTNLLQRVLTSAPIRLVRVRALPRGRLWRERWDDGRARRGYPVTIIEHYDCYRVTAAAAGRTRIAERTRPAWPLLAAAALRARAQRLPPRRFTTKRVLTSAPIRLVRVRALPRDRLWWDGGITAEHLPGNNHRAC